MSPVLFGSTSIRIILLSVSSRRRDSKRYENVQCRSVSIRISISYFIFRDERVHAISVVSRDSSSINLLLSYLHIHSIRRYRKMMIECVRRNASSIRLDIAVYARRNIADNCRIYFFLIYLLGEL